MTRSAYLTVASLAALYLFWLATWLVFGAELHGSARQYWSQAPLRRSPGWSRCTRLDERRDRSLDFSSFRASGSCSSRWRG
jgi:hypothetical protein